MANAFLVWHRDYNDSTIAAAFTHRELAEQYVNERDDYSDADIEELELLDAPVGRRPYYHYGASVFPDKTVECWDQTHESDDTDWLEDADDHLNDRAEPWDGHTQGHCGFHVSVFGRDREATEAARDKAVERYLPLCTGTCSCGRTERYVRSFDKPPTQTVPVRLIGGDRDGEVVPTEFRENPYDASEPARPPIDGLMLLHGTLPGGMSQSYYGPIKQQGDEWVRHGSTKPVEVREAT